jgi:hypothetical protein
MILLCFLASVGGDVIGGPATGKPRLPLSVVIEPALPGMTGDGLRPGDVVEFNVKAVPLVEAKELRLTAQLTGGAELVQGALEWSGPLSKGEEKKITFTVRVPQRGQGRIRVTATLVREGRRVVKSTAEYVLGTIGPEKEKPEHRLKRDSKGRDIIEY